jgi:hypothetical protein
LAINLLLLVINLRLGLCELVFGLSMGIQQLQILAFKGRDL